MNCQKIAESDRSRVPIPAPVVYQYSEDERASCINMLLGVSGVIRKGLIGSDPLSIEYLYLLAIFNCKLNMNKKEVERINISSNTCFGLSRFQKSRSLGLLVLILFVQMVLG